MQFLRAISEIRLGHPFRGAVPVDSEGRERVFQSKDLTEAVRGEATSLVRTELGKVDDRVRLDANAVVLQSRGTRFPALAARSDLIGAVVASPLYLIRPRLDMVEPGFLALILNSAQTQAELRAAATGSHIPQVSVEAIRDLGIPLPPMVDQRAIVALSNLVDEEVRISAALAATRAAWLHALARQRDGDGTSRNSRRHANAPG